MNYLILGGAGFIGQHLTRKLLSDPDNSVQIVDSLQTSALDHHDYDQYGDRFNFIHANIQELTDDALLELCNAADTIYHLAGSVGVEHIDRDPSGTLFNNLSLNNKLIGVFQKAGKHVIFSSTSEIYGEGPFTEDSNASIGPSCKLRWGYATAKFMMEFMLHASNIPVTIVRFFNVVGPGQVGDYGMVLPRFINAAKNNQDLIVYGTGSQMRSFCHIDDAINAVRLVSTIPGELFNIGNVEPVTIKQLADRVIALSGSASNVVLVPYDQAFSKHHGDISNRVPDLTKITRMTGYSPTNTLDDIIRSML